MADDFQAAHRLETFKSLVPISLEVFKALILINGGAAAGMLATLDKLVKVIYLDAVKWSMFWFSIGLVFAVLATFFSYFTQNRLHNENIGQKREGGHIKFIYASAFFCFLSIAAFCAGTGVAAFSIRSSVAP